MSSMRESLGRGSTSGPDAQKNPTIPTDAGKESDLPLKKRSSGDPLRFRGEETQGDRDITAMDYKNAFTRFEQKYGNYNEDRKDNQLIGKLSDDVQKKIARVYECEKEIDGLRSKDGRTPLTGTETRTYKLQKEAIEIIDKYVIDALLDAYKKPEDLAKGSQGPAPLEPGEESPIAAPQPRKGTPISALKRLIRIGTPTIPSEAGSPSGSPYLDARKSPILPIGEGIPQLSDPRSDTPRALEKKEMEEARQEYMNTFRNYSRDIKGQYDLDFDHGRAKELGNDVHEAENQLGEYRTQIRLGLVGKTTPEALYNAYIEATKLIKTTIISGYRKAYKQETPPVPGDDGEEAQQEIPHVPSPDGKQSLEEAAQLSLKMLTSRVREVTELSKAREKLKDIEANKSLHSLRSFLGRKRDEAENEQDADAWQEAFSIVSKLIVSKLNNEPLKKRAQKEWKTFLESEDPTKQRVIIEIGEYYSNLKNPEAPKE